MDTYTYRPQAHADRLTRFVSEFDLDPETAPALRAFDTAGTWRGWQVPITTAAAFRSYVTAKHADDPNGTWHPAGITEYADDEGNHALCYDDDESDVRDTFMAVRDEDDNVMRGPSGVVLYALAGWTWVPAPARPADTEDAAIQAAADAIRTHGGAADQSDPADPDETPDDDGHPRTQCGCGYPIVYFGADEGWQHEDPPYYWGDDHDPHPGKAAQGRAAAYDAENA